MKDTMDGNDGPNVTISNSAKVWFGILLPVLLFIANQAALLGATSGGGSWDGMALGLGSLVLIPGLPVLNCWVIPIRWIRRLSVFLAGMILPTLIGIVEYLWLLGPYEIRGALNSTIVAPYIWIWLFVLVLCTPLTVSMIRAFRLRRHQHGVGK